MNCPTCKTVMHPFGKKFACISCLKTHDIPTNKIKCNKCSSEYIEKIEPIDIWEQYKLLVEDNFYLCQNCGNDVTEIINIHNNLDEMLSEFNKKIKFSSEYLNVNYFVK